MRTGAIVDGAGSDSSGILELAFSNLSVPAELREGLKTTSGGRLASSAGV